MKTLLYKCDRCGREWAAGSKDAPQLWTIGLRYSSGDGVSQYSPTHPSAYKDRQWCRDCMDKLNIIIPVPKESAASTPPPTFEDMVREMIAEEVITQMNQGAS